MMPTPTYEHITTTTLSSNTSTVDFTSITSAYTDLILTTQTKSVNGSTAGHALRVNGDAGSGNYFSVVAAQYGSTSSSSMVFSNLGSSRTEGYAAWDAASNTDGMNQMAIIHFNSYSDTTKNKTFLTRVGSNAGNNNFNGNELIISTWNNTSAIDRITIINSEVFAVGSIFTLHGIKAG
jgi:hypothetical protein